MSTARDLLAGMLFDAVTYNDGQYDGPFYRQIMTPNKPQGKPAGIRFRSVGKPELDPALEVMPRFFAAHPIGEWMDINIDIFAAWYRKVVIASRMLDNPNNDNWLRSDPGTGVDELLARGNDAESRVRRSVEGLAMIDAVNLSHDRKWFHPSNTLIAYLSAAPDPLGDTLVFPF